MTRNTIAPKVFDSHLSVTGGTSQGVAPNATTQARAVGAASSTAPARSVEPTATPDHFEERDQKISAASQSASASRAQQGTDFIATLTRTTSGAHVYQAPVGENSVDSVAKAVRAAEVLRLPVIVQHSALGSEFTVQLDFNGGAVMHGAPSKTQSISSELAQARSAGRTGLPELAEAPYQHAVRQYAEALGSGKLQSRPDPSVNADAIAASIPTLQRDVLHLARDIVAGREIYLKRNTGLSDAYAYKDSATAVENRLIDVVRTQLAAGGRLDDDFFKTAVDPHIVKLAAE